MCRPNTLDFNPLAFYSLNRRGWRFVPPPGEPLMSIRHWQAVLLTAVVLCGLGGCSGNYKYNDNTYRPLGDPQAVNRGK
jgi:hypothetical protein